VYCVTKKGKNANTGIDISTEIYTIALSRVIPDIGKRMGKLNEVLRVLDIMFWPAQPQAAWVKLGLETFDSEPQLRRTGHERV